VRKNKKREANTKKKYEILFPQNISCSPPLFLAIDKMGFPIFGGWSGNKNFFPGPFCLPWLQTNQQIFVSSLGHILDFFHIQGHPHFDFENVAAEKGFHFHALPKEHTLPFYCL